MARITTSEVLNIFFLGHFHVRKSWQKFSPLHTSHTLENVTEYLWREAAWPREESPGSWELDSPPCDLEQVTYPLSLLQFFHLKWERNTRWALCCLFTATILHSVILNSLYFYFKRNIWTQIYFSTPNYTVTNGHRWVMEWISSELENFMNWSESPHPTE